MMCDDGRIKNCWTGEFEVCPTHPYLEKKIQKIIVKIEKIIVLSIWVFIHIIIDLLQIFFDIIEF